MAMTTYLNKEVYILHKLAEKARIISLTIQYTTKDQ